jgi:hypothetical protein
MRIRITPTTTGNPPGKLADAELHFDSGDHDGELSGLKLIGFSIWSSRLSGREDRRNVTFPARSYSVNGERRSFALLRPISDTTAHDRIKAAILEAYARSEGEQTIVDAYVDGLKTTQKAIADGEF